MTFEASISIYWEFKPFYRRWHWRRPLWSLNPIRWVFRVERDGITIHDYHWTLNGAFGLALRYMSEHDCKLQERQ